MHGVALDEYGVRPDAFAAACRAHAPKALYLVPTLQNPTAAVMPPERRAEIAEIARKHDVIVIEDDIYGFLMEQPLKPISALIPEHSLYITSLSKCIAPGLRIGYVAAPERYFDRVVAALHASSWMAPPMMAEASSILINNGGAARMAAWQRREAAARQTLARQILGDADYDSHPNAPLLWLKLPDPWRGEEFAGQARRRGVAISAAEVFAVGRQSMPHAVRICLTTPHERNDLVRALKIIAELLKEAPAPGLSIF